MMHATSQAILTAAYAEDVRPALIDHIGEDEMYIGYCTPDCTGTDDAKWLIKHVVTDADGLQSIFFAEGSRLYNKTWTERKNYVYKPTEGWRE